MMRSRVTWLAERLATSTRCHVLGMAVSTILVLAIGWLWTDPAIFVSDPNHSEAELNESIQLISSSSALRNQYLAAKRTREESEAVIDAVRLWLPTERDWTTLRAAIQMLAGECDLQVIALERGNEHFGSRVSVLDVHCELEGNYIDLCKFLEKLPKMQQPIWSDEIRIQREDDQLQSSPSDRAQLCVAVLSLRAPFAGKGSAAQKLLQMGAAK